MPQNLEQRLESLVLDIEAVQNGFKASPKELEKRSAALLTEIATSPERKVLAPKLQKLITALEALIQTLEDKH